MVRTDFRKGPETARSGKHSVRIRACSPAGENSRTARRPRERRAARMLRAHAWARRLWRGRRSHAPAETQQRVGARPELDDGAAAGAWNAGSDARRARLFEPDSARARTPPRAAPRSRPARAPQRRTAESAGRDGHAEAGEAARAAKHLLHLNRPASHAPAA